MMHDELDPAIYDKEFKGQKPTMDPNIEGVWMFKSKLKKSEVAVVYLNGYKDSYGDSRPENYITMGMQ